MKKFHTYIVKRLVYMIDRFFSYLESDFMRTILNKGHRIRAITLTDPGVMSRYFSMYSGFAKDSLEQTSPYSYVSFWKSAQEVFLPLSDTLALGS